MRILILLTLFLSTFAHADKLIIGGFSKHIGYPVELNESHPAIGLERDGVEYTFYHNSLERTSFALTRINRKAISKHFSIGARFGIATGYDDYTTKGKDGRNYTMNGMPLGLMPQAQFLITHESKYLTIDLGLAPISTLIFKVNV